MHKLQCTQCGTTYSGKSGAYQCAQCGSGLTISYDYQKIAEQLTRSELASGATGLWKYRKLLPVEDGADVVTLNEGGTRLHKCDRIAQSVGLDDLYVKDETGNPTGTYKDRPASVGVTVAQLMGAKIVAIASDGNAAPSVAAYAAKAGLQCFTFMPETTPLERLIQVQMYGAPVITLDGSVNECIDLVEKGRQLYGWHHMSTAGPVNPYQREGSKTIAFEICEQLKWQVPEWVAAPVGGGGLLAALWQGFIELKTLGLIDRLPRMLAAQAAGCAPLVRAFKAGDPPSKIRRWEHPNTVATTIEVPFPLDGAMALEAVRDSGGTAVDVEDHEILAMTRQLSSTEGILVEPTGAASMAAVAKAKKAGTVGNGMIVSVATGTGLKTLSLFASLWGMGKRRNAVKPEDTDVAAEHNHAKLEIEREVLTWAQSIHPSAAIVHL